MPSFSLSRSIDVNAPTDAVHALVDDFRAWPRWSPWEGLDPDLQRTYAGPETGVGSTYAWSGNKKAGEGRMEIIESTPHRIVTDLVFVKPFKATNVSAFDFLQVGGGHTRVTWTMAGSRNPLMTVLGKLFFDKAIAKDFDRGLAALKAAAESR